MSKWLTKFKEEKSVENKDSLRERAHQMIMIRLEYNRLLEREKKAEAWMDDPRRTDEEIEKWLPLFQEILAGLNRIIDKIGLNYCTQEERLNGFNVPGLLGNEISLEELPPEWRNGIDRDTFAKAAATA